MALLHSISLVPQAPQEPPIAERPSVARGAESRVRIALERHRVDVVRLEPVDTDASGVRFAAEVADGSFLYVKHAGDESDAELPPRHRLVTERRTLLHLAEVGAGCEIPQVEFYDAPTGTLALHLPPSGRRAPFDRSVSLDTATAAARFLARLHSAPAPVRPLQGSAERELKWWSLRLRQALDTAATDTAWLYAASTAAAGSYVLHGCARLSAFRSLGSAVLAMDFDEASSFGDPAYDLGALVASTVQLCCRAGHTALPRNVTRRVLAAYGATGDVTALPRLVRALAFAGVIVGNPRGQRPCASCQDSLLAAAGEFARAVAVD